MFRKCREHCKRGDNGTPGLGAFAEAPREGWLFPPGHPHHQPHQATTSLEEQQAAQRAEWEVQDLNAEAELDRL